MDWNQYFISEAYLAARKSKDTSTQVGAVIVGPDQEIRSKGFNGPPRGFNDDDPTIHERPLKYSLAIHAELNALLNCCLCGTASKGCQIYVTWHPCSLCAGSITQAGIREVIIHAENPGSPNGDWEADRQIAERIFRECGVTVRKWSGIPLISGILNGGKILAF